MVKTGCYRSTSSELSALHSYCVKLVAEINDRYVSIPKVVSLVFALSFANFLAYRSLSDM